MSKKILFYFCLPDVQRNCVCTPDDVKAGRDCGIEMTKIPKKERR